ncbi:hypothetical protein A0H81_02949 [Grifola frondosa]|uniref:T6SS Phospholipase effector Tle1-like catalytic domain-containing protein n=1 Tax=Grifola frondosa TaxID=5627 RepID=A0A1C7MK76_GRIFR|nr:hypothetical protein A0H81_02949 [Grifola frondosa]
MNSSATRTSSSQPHCTSLLAISRTLVLCFDGTGNEFDDDNSNVVQLVSMLKKDDPRQMVYYQAGIGTYTVPEVVTSMTIKFRKTVDCMFASHLDAHVMGGYEFLMQNYRPGDKICLFGFSRGAYTARALAGMIHKIEFIGVWETVRSVGFTNRRLPFTASCSAIKTFRHALSLDERRVKFKENLYHAATKESPYGTCCGESKRSAVLGSVLDKIRPSSFESDVKDGESHKEETNEGHDSEPTDVLEVWFAGCHSVCKSHHSPFFCWLMLHRHRRRLVPNDTPRNLARIPLRWMIRECLKMQTGILFHPELLRGVGIELDPSHQSRLDNSHLTTTNEPADGMWLDEQEDRQDALCSIYDQLKIRPLWWLLELLPVWQHEQEADEDARVDFSSPLQSYNSAFSDNYTA